MRKVRVGVAVVGALALTIAGAGMAEAVSTGGYSPSQQDCRATADANTTQAAEPGCHNAKVNVADPSGRRYAQVGTGQEAQGQNVHSLDVSVTPNGQTPGTPASGPSVGTHLDTNYQPIPAGQCGLEDIALYGAEEAAYLAGQGSKPCPLDPTKWNPPSVAPTVQPSLHPGTPDGSAVSLLSGGQVYIGADDNVDSGEHDGVNGQYGTSKAANGPSDGGNVEVNWHPGQTATWLADLMVLAHGGSPAPVAENPLPVADAGGGSCADGICWGAYTAQRSLYQGGGGTNGKSSSRDVYNYQGKTFGPYDCNSGSPQSEKACVTEGHHTVDWYRQQEARNVTAEPGVTVYEDPDPQSSPALPNQLYPLPAVYAGTCGIAAGGGTVKAPPSPVTNGAGQVVVAPTRC
jgi:uncharacterized low-complexity protein